MDPVGRPAERDLMHELLDSHPNHPAQNGTLLLLRNEIRSDLRDFRKEVGLKFKDNEQRHDRFEHSIDLLAQKVASLDRDVGEIKRNVEKIMTVVGSLQTRTDSLEGRMENVETRLENVERRLEKLESKMDWLIDKFMKVFPET